MIDLERVARGLCAVDRVDPDALAYVGMKPMRCWQARLPAARAAAIDVIEQLLAPTPDAALERAVVRYLTAAKASLEQP